MNLSNWSIDLLKSDNIKRYKGYVLNEWENNFETYFSLGTAFAGAIESRHKTGDYRVEYFAKTMEQEFINAGSEDYEENLGKLHELIENAKLVITERNEEGSEFTAITPLYEGYDLKCKYDALWEEYGEDYKTVDKFTKEDKRSEKYGQQVSLYQYSEYKRTGKKKVWKVVEIKKGKPTFPQKKADIIAMIPEGVSTEGTCDELRARLYLHTKPEWVSQTITFEWRDEIIEEVESLIRRAIKKANYLKTLELDDIL